VVKEEVEKEAEDEEELMKVIKGVAVDSDQFPVD
jgi:hypothetical protein